MSPCCLRDIWPSSREIAQAVERAVTPGNLQGDLRHIFDGDERWWSLNVPEGALYEWDPNSTYLREPPFVRDVPDEPPRHHRHP